MIDQVFVQRILNVFQFDNTDWLWWRTDSGETRFFVKCSDTFAMSSADLEGITHGDIYLLEKTLAEVKALCGLGLLCLPVVCQPRQELQAYAGMVC